MMEEGRGKRGDGRWKMADVRWKSRGKTFLSYLRSQFCSFYRNSQSYFAYFNRKIKSLFDSDKIKNFLSKQNVFLGDNTSSVADDIKLLLDNAFVLLKRYSEEKWETKANVLGEENCCEKCCENICG